MSYDQRGHIGSLAADSVDTFGDNLEGVDIKTRVGLVENGEVRFEQRKLKYFGPLLLAPEKPSLT